MKPVRFARLRSALSILERRADGHHVVAYDPTEREAEAPGRRAQGRSPRGREEPRQTRGRRVIREGEEDLEEVVRTSRRRQTKTADMAEGEVDKIQIEVGSVKALESKHGVYRGAFWIVLLSLLLWWIPILGPAVAGYIGGRKAGGPLRAVVAALIPVSIAFGALAIVSASTAAVPAVVRHFVEAGYTGVLGRLPFDFPILEYVFGNLAAIMNSGPDALFTVLAFALAGGAVTQMKIEERMVPPITARLPASRVLPPVVQAPARALGRNHQAQVDDLVERLNEVLARAEKERRAMARARASGTVTGGFASSRPRWGWLHWGRRADDSRTMALEGQADEREEADLDAASRQVVAHMLSSTPPPTRGERRHTAAKVPEVDLDLPSAIAFASSKRAAGAEGRVAAHQYRPSKLYHIYGTSVNPVARAKLEKRLRRTHTLHVLRRGARSFAEMVEVAPEDAPFTHKAASLVSEKPRSLESSALTADLHYDALEHLENASFDAPRRHAAPPRADEDDLGGIIAHLGEDGEAVAEEPGEGAFGFVPGPMFDRRGRQRARIAGESAPPPANSDARLATPVKKPAAPPALVREAIAAVEAKTGHTALVEESHGRSRIARSADRAELTSTQRERVDRWLKRTMAAPEIGAVRAFGRASPAPNHEGKGEEPKSDAPPAGPEQGAPPEPKVEKKREAKRSKADEPAPAFEITHGSTQVDAEAPSSETDSGSPKKLRSASEILREIRLQKRAEKEAEAGEEVARAARRAKDVADEIERHAREGAGAAPIVMVALAAKEQPQAELARTAPKRRHRSEDLEEVRSDSEKLSPDLELTLSPIREEVVQFPEVGGEETVHAEAAPSPPAADPIPMVGEGERAVSLAEAVESAAEAATLSPAPEAERDVKPGDVVLAGPSTDVALGEAGEGELSELDQERVRRRLQEGWNRL